MLIFSTSGPVAAYSCRERMRMHIKICFAARLPHNCVRIATAINESIYLMRTFNRHPLAIALALAAGFSLSASAAALKVGDPAPKLQTGKFVQGDPVTEF